MQAITAALAGTEVGGTGSVLVEATGEVAEERLRARGLDAERVGHHPTVWADELPDHVEPLRSSMSKAKSLAAVGGEAVDVGPVGASRFVGGHDVVGQDVAEEVRVEACCRRVGDGRVERIAQRRLDAERGRDVGASGIAVAVVVAARRAHHGGSDAEGDAEQHGRDPPAAEVDPSRHRIHRSQRRRGPGWQHRRAGPTGCVGLDRERGPGRADSEASDSIGDAVSAVGLARDAHRRHRPIRTRSADRSMSLRAAWPERRRHDDDGGSYRRVDILVTRW